MDFLVWMLFSVIQYLNDVSCLLASISEVQTEKTKTKTQHNKTEIYSRLSLNGHLYKTGDLPKTDTYSWSLPFFTPFI